ncbi:peptide deformylase [Streptomyces sp. C36]|uniref:peptide deformylase n=1 Tax=Streptomyces sp. C36 TaxID=3237122 RepID=UPI0034C6DB79
MLVVLRRPRHGPSPPDDHGGDHRLDGTEVTTVYERGLARLVAHEIDHLDGLLYTARVRPGVEPIPAEEYRQTGRAWTYDQ